MRIPFLIEASGIGALVWYAESGSTTRFMTRKIAMPKNIPQTMGLSLK